MEKIKLMILNVTKEKINVVFTAYSQELTIQGKPIDLFNLETGKQEMEDFGLKNYEALFEHCKNTMEELLRILDIDLIEAWNIFYKYETFSNIGEWESWENIETIKDLDLRIKTYDKIAEHVKQSIEKHTKGDYQ